MTSAADIMQLDMKCTTEPLSHAQTTQYYRELQFLRGIGMLVSHANLMGHHLPAEAPKVGQNIQIHTSTNMVKFVMPYDLSKTSRIINEQRKFEHDMIIRAATDASESLSPKEQTTDEVEEAKKPRLSDAQPVKVHKPKFTCVTQQAKSPPAATPLEPTQTVQDHPTVVESPVKRTFGRRAGPQPSKSMKIVENDSD